MAFERNCGLLVLGALVAALSSGPASADDAYDRCLDGSSSNADWSECGVAYLDRLDGQLNEKWQIVFPQLTEEGQTLLRAEQRAWNTFKEASCLYYSNGDYGREGEVLNMVLCRAQILEQRVDYLNDLMHFVGTGED